MAFKFNFFDATAAAAASGGSDADVAVGDGEPQPALVASGGMEEVDDDVHMVTDAADGASAAPIDEDSAHEFVVPQDAAKRFTASKYSIAPVPIPGAPSSLKLLQCTPKAGTTTAPSRLADIVSKTDVLPGVYEGTTH